MVIGKFWFNIPYIKQKGFQHPHFILVAPPKHSLVNLKGRGEGGIHEWEQIVKAIGFWTHSILLQCKGVGIAESIPGLKFYKQNRLKPFWELCKALLKRKTK